MTFRSAAGLLVLMAGASASAAAPEPRGEFVPEWAKHAVWYQIFPERFRNGDRSSDPRKEDISGAFPDLPDLPWQIHPWGSDWYARQPWERSRDLPFHDLIQRRRYGGDLQGIIDKLGYLQDLGINAIYLNPVFESPSSHKYDAVSYHHIDPNFGPDPVGDRKLIAEEEPSDPSTWKWTSADKLALRLIREAHARGMRVIFDGVFNHMGARSWPLQDVIKRQQESPCADWFCVKSWKDDASGAAFDYEGWGGYKTLPEFREDGDGIVAGPRDYIFAATRRWMDPEGFGDPSLGIDGWRLDVAYCVGHPFWKKWRQFVKSINPQAYLTAEVIDSAVALKPYLQGDEFDAVMNYNFAMACSGYFSDEKKRSKTSEFVRRLEELRGAFPPGVAEVQQNLFGSHDTDRIGSHILNRDKHDASDWPGYFNFSKAQSGRYDTRKPGDREREAQKLFAVFQMTYVGAPMIYYGDEVGMWGANDPDCRKPMLWDDLAYEDEVALPDGSKRPVPDRVGPDKGLRDHYRKLIGIRRQFPALRVGTFEVLVADDENGVLAFRRRLGAEEVVVALNNSGGERTVVLALGVDWKDLLSGLGLRRAPGGASISLPPRGAAILVRR